MGWSKTPSVSWKTPPVSGKACNKLGIRYARFLKAARSSAGWVGAGSGVGEEAGAIVSKGTGLSAGGRVAVAAAGVAAAGAAGLRRRSATGKHADGYQPDDCVCESCFYRAHHAIFLVGQAGCLADNRRDGIPPYDFLDSIYYRTLFIKDNGIIVVTLYSAVRITALQCLRRCEISLVLVGQATCQPLSFDYRTQSIKGNGMIVVTLPHGAL